MASFFHRIVAIAAVHLQFAGMQLVTEGNWLPWLMAYIHNRWMNRCEQARRQITSDRQSSDGRQSGKFVDPSGKVELLHRESPEIR